MTIEEQKKTLMTIDELKNDFGFPEGVARELLDLRAEGEKIAADIGIVSRNSVAAHCILLELFKIWAAEMDPKKEQALWDEVSRQRGLYAEMLVVYDEARLRMSSLLLEIEKNFKIGRQGDS